MSIPPISSLPQLIDAVRALGILPFFQNTVPGFSLEERVSPAVWFAGDIDGPWEWKGPTIREGLVYAKLFGGKAVFLTREWYAELANVRRNGGDFDTMRDEGLLTRNEMLLYEAFGGDASLSSRELRARSGLKKGAAEGAITRLQMDCLMLTADFDYDVDAAGRTYGWGVSRFALTDTFLDEGFVDDMQRHTVDESRALLLEHLTRQYGIQYEGTLLRMIR